MNRSSVSKAIRPQASSLTREAVGPGASDVRLVIAAVVSSVLTLALMGWLWGSLAVQPGVLTTFVEKSTRLSWESVDHQARCLSGKQAYCR
ncbi:hypothetical protein ACN2WE_00780 [Streptomyces sp. cg28]|uniref:hypothetical protein n=1 Tax=Streptomyces sp. cg28 TaxID=3403457 RepID=UPI003B21F7EF